MMINHQQHCPDYKAEYFDKLNNGKKGLVGKICDQTDDKIHCWIND